MNNVKYWIRWAKDVLSRGGLNFDNGLQTAAAEAEYLVCHALGLPFENARALGSRRVTAAEETRLRALVERRVHQRVPVAYLTGEAFFAGHRFHVDSRVLIPRSRLENIIDDPQGLPGLMGGVAPKHVLDLCTGSGCIALAAAMALPQARVVGTDLSAAALDVARLNLQRMGLASRVRFLQSDLFDALKGERFDLILTNPPYVAEAEWRTLPVEYRHEPDMAFRAGNEGMDLVERILAQSPDHLHRGGWLVCEVGDDTQNVMQRRWPDFPGEWLQFHFDASGVFAIEGAALAAWNGRKKC
ncbi:MAG: 50S ribosomal protein L3 N(5)-glutamine methyltransferase [Magnetococcus sp. WYHC-3]